jgi:hypothetical protein
LPGLGLHKENATPLAIFLLLGTQVGMWIMEKKASELNYKRGIICDPSEDEETHAVI